MLAIKGLTDFITDEEVHDILERHINEVLKRTIVYIGALTNDTHHFKNWKKLEKKKIRKDLCSTRVESDEERKEYILSLIRKLYADEICDLESEEKFILMKACSSAIDMEEMVINHLIVEDDMKLESWMWDRYQIRDTDERRKVISYLEKHKLNRNLIENPIFENKPIYERERILDVIGKPNMLLFEYPTVINLVFSKEEYNLLLGIYQNDLEARNKNV